MTSHVRALAGAIELKDAEGDAAGIVNAALAELRSTIDDRLKAVETKSDATALIGRLDKLEAKLNRPAIVTGRDELSAERKAFTGYARHGDQRPDLVEVKTLTVSADANGGYLAPDEFANEILKLTTEFSPIRAYANVTTVGADKILFPRRTGSVAASWVAEIDPRTASQPSFEQVAIENFELATYTDASVKLLEDNAYNLEGFLSAEFGERFGMAEGLAFVKGTGAGQPKGLLTAAGIAEIKTGVAADFPATNPADVLVKMFHALPTVHSARGCWIMNRKTLGLVRLWKDAQGRYLVNDPKDGGFSTLFGRPVIEATDMPDVAAGAFPIMFGDLSGYRIVDRVGLSFLRDPYSLAGVGQVRFHARKRTGADVTHPDRFVKLKVAA
ncbi:phage major capsid protein [Methylopila sp. Yamaguchi]|uniref:phage major capsid protein n=1 Tax=Methylopila sp. Yamaguchi TaxID=1437817 RepID=UPI000CB1455F|nr:phage major capsid protein [Methylopila sp. Yamaguchi]GBD48531.1 phage major capsid protein, HK97 [Methylopila sp. Yamaguchi]